MLVFGLVFGQREPEVLSHKAGPRAKKNSEARLQER